MNDGDDNNGHDGDSHFQHNASYAKHFYGNVSILCDSPLDGQNIIVSACCCLTLRANKCI